MILKLARWPAGASLVGPRTCGKRHLGIAGGGPADEESCMLANLLVGNGPGSVAVELTLTGAEFVAEGAGWVSVVGGADRLRRNGVEIPSQHCVYLGNRDTLGIGPGVLGARTYVALVGGISRVGSDLHSQAIGVVRNRALIHQPSSLLAGPIRVLDGPEAIPELLEALCSAEFRVSLDSSRMGVRLEGSCLPTLAEMHSKPVVPGTVQLTNAGLPIILGVDGPTIGGYPRLAVVASVDMDRIGQLRPGDAVRFEAVTLEAARALRQARVARLRELALWLS